MTTTENLLPTHMLDSNIKTKKNLQTPRLQTFLGSLLVIGILGWLCLLTFPKLSKYVDGDEKSFSEEHPRTERRDRRASM